MAKRRRKKKSGKCINCYKVRELFWKQLCKRCFSIPSVREKYEREPTMEELEALIAKRLPTMPDSKNDEEFHARPKRSDSGIRIYEDPARILNQLKRNR